MKIAFIIPMLEEYDIDVAYKNIERACKDSKVDFNVVFALNARLDVMFTRIRNVFSENENVKAFMPDRIVNQHKLITLAMQTCENYDAVVIYSGKEEVNSDVVKAFIASYQAGNKIVYLKKVYRGFAKVWASFKNVLYKLGIFMLNIFKDFGAENDIQLLDQDVVKTINKLPHKNQLLRTLDSMLYYNTDVIHLQVDPNEYVNPIYSEKGKNYYSNATASYISLIISILCGLTSILLPVFSIHIHFLFHLLFWSVSTLAFFMFIVFHTKKKLAVRVGKEFDVNEMKSLSSKIEYYNF